MLLDLIKVPEPEIDESGSGRFYIHNGQKYPSITTVLGATADKSGLEAWRNRIGIEEANKRSREATTIGTELHLLCENQLYGNEIPKASPSATAMFRGLSPILCDRVSSVNAIECPLHSNRLKVAGRTDLIANFDNIKSIIDYKSNHGSDFKKDEYILDYKLQSAFYALAHLEMGFGPIKQGVLLIANKYCTQVVKFDIMNFIKPLKERIDAYYQL